MHPAIMPFRLLHLAIGAAILSLLIRTWIVMGLVEPVIVAGSSMAPTLVGPHVEAECDRCQQMVRIGANQVPRDEYLPCPYCDGGQVVLSEAAMRRGTLLWIDRATYEWRNPRRWEVVVFRSPAEDGQLCVKRVVGLPGERVHLAGGDVWIDGQRQIKTLREQRSVRQLLRRGENYVGAAGETKCPAPCFAGGCPYDDDVIYNARLSRPLNVLSDFLFSASLTCRGEGRLLLGVEDGPVSYQIALIPRAHMIRLTRMPRRSRQGRMIVERRLQADIPRNLAAGGGLLEVSTFDRQLLVAIDGDVQLSHPLGDIQMPTQSIGNGPFAVGSERLEVWLTEVTLWRDIYYQPLPAGAALAGRGGQTGRGGQAGCFNIWQLAPDKLFLLGDNAPISADSRVWANPGVPRRLVVGRPVALR